MPIFLSFLLGGLLNIAGSLAGRVLIGLGISVVTYTGISGTLDWLKSGAIGAFSALPANIVGMLATMKVGSCIAMVFSAIVVKYTLSGLTSGAIRKWIK